MHFNDKVQYSPPEEEPRTLVVAAAAAPPAGAIERRKRKLSNPVQLPSYCTSNSNQQQLKKTRIMSENRSESPPKRAPQPAVKVDETKKPTNGNPSSSSGSSSPVDVGGRNIEENNIVSKC